MRNNQKLQAFILIVIVAIALVIATIISAIRNKIAEEKYDDTAPIPIEHVVDEQMVKTDIALTDFEECNPGETDIHNYPTRVAVMNLSELAKTSLPEYGLQSLELYLDKYFNFYLETGVNYMAYYEVDSYHENMNYPYFYIYIEDLDLRIQCTYQPARQIYHFISDLNPEGN